MDPMSKPVKAGFEKCGAADSSGTYLYVVPAELRDDSGNLRVHVYSDQESEFLEDGYGFKTDVKTKDDHNAICVKMPGPGSYAVALMHDRNANGKADIFKEGFGFSNNPALGLSKPDHKEVLIKVPAGKTAMTVKLNYLFGNDEKKVKKRRRMRRD